MTRVLKMVIATVTLAALIVLGLFIWNDYETNRERASVPIVTDNTSKVQAPSRSELLSLVNNERVRAGVKQLDEDSRADTSAQFKADDMFTRNYFDHKDPVTGRNNGLDKLSELDQSCRYVSENITQNTVVNDSTHAVSAWINSKPHHDAMIDPRYDTTGFGISGNYIVEHFCDK